MPSRKMTSAFVFILYLMFGCFVSYSSAGYAAPSASGDLPTSDDIQAQLQALTKQKNLSAQDKLVEQDLTQTLDVLEKISRVKQETSQLQAQVKAAPDQLRQATDNLNALAGQDSDDVVAKNFAGMTLRQLEAKLSAISEDLQAEQNNLATYNSQLVTMQTQPERAQTAMLSASQQLQQVRNALNGTSGGGALRPSQQVQLQAQQVLLQAQIDQQRKSLEGNTAIQDALQKQRDYSSERINLLERQMQLVQQAASNKRLSLTERTVQEAVTPEDSSRIQNNPLVRQEMDVNQQLSQRLLAATQSGNELVARNVQVKNWLDRAQQSEHTLKEQISVLKGSLLLSRILYQQQQTLPSADELEDMSDRIADLRLEQFNVNQQRDELFQTDAVVAKLEEGHKDEVNGEVHDALLQLMDMRRELLDQLNKQLGSQLMMSINLQVNQQQLMSVSQTLRKMLTQQIFWVNSNKPMNWDWFKAFPQALKSQVKSLKVTTNWHKALNSGFVAFLAGLPLLLIAGLIRWRFVWMNQYLARLNSEVGQFRHDSHLHTPKAIGINLLKALPVCLIILAVGLILYAMELNISELLWSFAKQLALFWLVFGLCWRILEKDGVAIRHFSMPDARTSHWRRQIVRISLALLPLLFWIVIGELTPLSLMDDVMGQFMMFINLLVIAVLVWPMCRDSWRDKESHALRLVTITLLSIIPVALLVLTSMGYFYTTLRLAGRCIETVYLVIVWNLLYQTVLRGLSIAARRIAYRRAVARRQNTVKEGAEGAEPVEEPPLGLDQINQQTLRIAVLLMFALFGLLFWAIWSDLITVFTYLDSITLWHASGTDATGAVTRNVTLGSLLFAVIAFMVSWALIKNLPGLLEVLVLSRLKMRQGASYAIVTILNYAIIAIGAMVVFGSLGVSWGKLQWLAAALSVGLGFGLQEIFGNFVSGLIILFERPVRIGDTVTIGTFSGTVSKIRIRATTITDFDRKEVIIPNKAFVTERLINWSLSDTITRVVIQLGVAYGSDLDKVREILLKAAKEHPRVMHDPEPTVFFTTFGASTLDHELRLYVRELRDRSYTVDELNRTIDRLCRENGIDIAFNQLEVHLHNASGEQVTEVKRDLDGKQTGELPAA
ncbi:mechanosensitive channel MscK [Shimwellia pseudoproteus]|uniref:mechanosensitive channel MscK n=1 Tax=Shimwellia pseudoproteus TaxID=570012 RepID=UPI0022B90CBB|nr:mechanosensitive channel MscK [Shimwellia pseudoproteus]MBJ3814646.1 mechanosensitive channel MscK [Shimwellia pseudoproteus]